MKQIYEVRTDISALRTYWSSRNTKFKDWYEILILVDQLESKGMETYVSNEPETFYNMAHYLLTKGELLHIAPIEAETAQELDRRARISRGCSYMWSMIDRERQLGGSMPYIDELGFYLLVLGWYSCVLSFDGTTGLLQSQIWNPYDTFPRFANGKLSSCVHSYGITIEEAKDKAETNGWKYEGRGVGTVTLDDYFLKDNEGLHNIIFLDSQDVTGWVDRPEMELLVAPVGGFPDKGSLSPYTRDWRRLTGRSIFEVNQSVSESFNKWKSMLSQILRDTAQPVTEEFSATPQATTEQLRERGAFFHYAPGEQGLKRLEAPVIPLELQAHLLEIRRELQKGSFSDAVYGMLEGQPGYALSLLASSSANQILYPYMDAKHFIVAEHDRFWLSSLKSSRRVFEVKGKLVEKLKPTDIPDDVSIIVDSEVATPKDWLERATIGNMLKDQLDSTTIMSEIYKFPDPQAIRRRKSLDRMLEHPITQLVEMIASYRAHAKYLEEVRGDKGQADLFRKAALALENQLGAPAPGQGKPEEMSRIQAEREAGAPGEVARVSSSVAPPEARQGWTPAELRSLIGRGRLGIRRK